MQASQVIPNRSQQTVSVWTSLSAWGYFHAETGKGLPQNIATKLEDQNCLEMSLYAVALRFPFTGTKGSSPTHGKQPQTIIPPPLNYTIGTMNCGR